MVADAVVDELRAKKGFAKEVLFHRGEERKGTTRMNFESWLDGLVFDIGEEVREGYIDGMIAQEEYESDYSEYFAESDSVLRNDAGEYIFG